MTLRSFLLLMTGVAVIGDALLHPFYPLYFARVFQVHDAAHVGRYIATCSLLVLLAFPLWAAVARRIPVLKLLIATQLAAGALSWLCSLTHSLTAFWLLSMGMMACKASYLLIYPYVMSNEPVERQLGTIGLLAFVVYFGNILAAVLSGVVLELAEPRALFELMAIADGAQMLLCAYWLRRVSRAPHSMIARAAPAATLDARFLLKLGSVMFLLYFSAYLSEPFFAEYWEQVSASQNKLASGAVFAIPGVAALFALWRSSRPSAAAATFSGVLPSIAVASVALFLQATSAVWLVLCGRFLYGWALFQTMIRLDSLLFRASTPDTYATDFSKANVFQGMGVLFAGSSAGALVPALGLKAPLLVAAGGFSCGALLYAALFRAEWQRAANEGSAAA